MFERLSEWIESNNSVIFQVYRAHNINCGYREKSPFHSFSDMTDTLRAPLAKPIVCLVVAVHQLIRVFSNTAMMVLQLSTFSPVNAAKSFFSAVNSLLLGVYCVLKAALEAIVATSALVSRLVFSTASLFSNKTDQKDNRRDGYNCNRGGMRRLA